MLDISQLLSYNLIIYENKYNTSTKFPIKVRKSDMIENNVFEFDKDDVCFESCGQFVSRGEWIHPRRIGNSFEIILVLSGKVYICEENDSFVLEKNDVLILSPDKEHYGFRPSKDVSFYWVHFYSDARLCEKFFRFSDTAQLVSLFRMLLHNKNTPFYPKSSAGYLVRLIINELSFLSKKVEKSDNAAYKAAEYVTANLRLRLTVSDVAKHLGYNPDYLCRLFNRVFGTNLKKFIADETVKRAKIILTEGGKTPGSAAEELGFENENLFSKFFKYHEGMTPSQYISMCYNTHINYK